jgi:hypothetical protein
MISLAEQILDHLIDGLECDYNEQNKHYEIMFIKLAKYRSRISYMKRRHEEGKQP